MYGRELGSHSCPPIILPSSRGTAAWIHTHAHTQTQKKQKQKPQKNRSEVRFAFDCSSNVDVCLSELVSLYQQLQSSAAEPTVSWCQVQVIRGHLVTQRLVFIHHLGVRSPSSSHKPVFPYFLVTDVNRSLILLLVLYLSFATHTHTRPVLMSPVPSLTIMSPQVEHLLMLTVLTTNDRQTGRQRAWEKDHL